MRRIVFHKDSTYDYHFIINELAEEFEGQFEYLGENTEKYVTFSLLIKKKITKIDKDGNDKMMTISYKIKFIECFRFMSRSLSNLVDNLSEGRHSDKCTDCKSCLEYMITNDEQLIFKYFECKKNYKRDFNIELIKRFANIYMNFSIKILINLFCYLEKVFIPMNTSIVGKDLMKHHIPITKLFIAA